MSSKVCSKCGQTKLLTGFSRNSRSPGGYHPACKDCRALADKSYYKRTREQRLKSFRVAKLRRYGLTPEEYDQMVAAQGGLCASCGDPPTAGDKLCVDHCHDTGRIRGLLCRSCNLGIGYFRNDPARLQDAIVYLWRLI